MFEAFRRTKQEGPLDDQIGAVLLEMDGVGVSSEQYPKLMGYLERLTKLKDGEHPERLSRNTIAIVAGNVLVVLVTVAYEQRHILSTKSFIQLVRPKSKSIT